MVRALEQTSVFHQLLQYNVINVVLLLNVVSILHQYFINSYSIWYQYVVSMLLHFAHLHMRLLRHIMRHAHLFLFKTNAWRRRTTLCCSQPLLLHLCTQVENWESRLLNIERQSFNLSFLGTDQASSQNTSRFLASRLFSRLTILSTGSAANQSAKFGFTCIHNPHVNNSQKLVFTSTVAPISAARRSR